VHAPNVYALVHMHVPMRVQTRFDAHSEHAATSRIRHLLPYIETMMPGSKVVCILGAKSRERGEFTNRTARLRKDTTSEANQHRTKVHCDYCTTYTLKRTKRHEADKRSQKTEIVVDEREGK
jgi:hypothetical protein